MFAESVVADWGSRKLLNVGHSEVQKPDTANPAIDANKTCHTDRCGPRGTKGSEPLGSRRLRGLRRLSRFLCGAFDFPVKLAPENRNFPGRGDTDSNGVPFDSGDHDLDIISDHDRFPNFA